MSLRAGCSGRFLLWGKLSRGRGERRPRWRRCRSIVLLWSVFSNAEFLGGGSARGRPSSEHVRPRQLGVRDGGNSAVAYPALVLLLGNTGIPRLRRQLVRFVFKCRLAILDGLTTRDSEGFKKVDPLFTLQLQLVEAFHKCLFCLGPGCEVREDSVGVVVVDMLKGLLPAPQRLAFVALHRAHQLLCLLAVKRVGRCGVCLPGSRSRQQ